MAQHSTNKGRQSRWVRPVRDAASGDRRRSVRSVADGLRRGEGKRHRSRGFRALWLQRVREVIESSGRGLPADRVLRDVLKRNREVGTPLSREVAGGVSAYYRWYRWVAGLKGVEGQLQAALELEERYQKVPQGFSDAELRKHVVPPWVWGAMGYDPDWCRFLQRDPVLWLRVASLGLGAKVASELGNCLAGPPSMPESLRYEGEGDVFGSDAFREGRVEVQDLSSQAVSLLCGVRPGQHWWDVCAGEGGKTLHLAVLMRGRGVVWASDRSAWRLSRLKRRAARAGVFNYQASRWECGEEAPMRGGVDGALVDAPCTGLGTWQRNPQARWTVQPADVEELAALQLRLLRSAADKVKGGGRLVYSVCTLTRRETTGVVHEFERLSPEFEPMDLRHPWHSERSGSRQWLKPWAEGGNGMFVAAWRRRRS